MAVTNLGTGGAALDARSGSTSGADTNDPLFLAHAGTNYVYLPGTKTDLMSVPDETALQISGSIDLRARIACDDWTPGSSGAIIGRHWASAAWSLRVNTSGTLRFSWNDGSARTADSTAAPTVADGAALWVRCTRDTATGDVKFYTAPDSASVPSSWTQLGTTVASTPSSFIPGSDTVRIGHNASSGAGLPMKVYRAQVWSGIEGSGGTTVLDVDTSVITSGAATSFTATTGQTVTINRSTSGRKAVAVTAPVWLLGTDDMFEIPSDDGINFTAGQSFTVMAVHRSWATFGTNDALVAKKANTTAATQGWALTAGSSTAAQAQLQAGDGSNGTTAVSGSRTSGARSVVFGVRDVAADTFTVYVNGTGGTPVTDATTGSLANSEVMRIGRLSGAGTEYADAEFEAVAVWPRVLDAAERALVQAMYESRWP